MSCGLGEARDQVVALLDPVAFLNVDHLALGDQVFDGLAFLGNDGDLALGLVVADEFDAARDLCDDRIVLGMRASNSSATRGRPPVMSRVLAASRLARASTSPASTT
jgi:hypothetical protein